MRWGLHTLCGNNKIQKMTNCSSFVNMNGGDIMKKERIEKKGKNTFTKRVLSMLLATVVATGIFAGTGVTLDMFLTKAAAEQVKTLYDILCAVPDPELRNYVFAEDDISNSSRDYAAEKTTVTANYFAQDADTAAELQGSLTTYKANRDRTKALGSKENPFVMLEIVPTESKAMWGYHFPGYEPAAVNSVEFQTGNATSYSSIMGAIIDDGENNSKEYYYTNINGQPVYVFDGIERFKLQQAYYEGKNYKTVAVKEATAMDQYGIYVKAKNNNYTFDANTGELAVVSSYAANGKTYVSSDNTFYELTGVEFSPVARILPDWNSSNDSETVYSELKDSYGDYNTIETDYGINYIYQIYEDGAWKVSNKDAMNNHLSGYTTYIWSGYDFYDTYTGYNIQSIVRTEFSGEDKEQKSEYKKSNVYKSGSVIIGDKDMIYGIRKTAVYGISQFQSFVVSNNVRTGINTQGLPYFHVTSNNLFLKYSVGLAYGASVYSATATVNESDTGKRREYKDAETVLKAIENYHYVLVTITPEELNVNRSLIYAADMIGISGYADNGGSGIEQLFFEVPNTEVLSVYVNDNGIKKVFKGVNDKIKANGVNASTFVENDLDWSTTAAIFIRHIESDIPLIFDGSMAGKKIEGSSSSFMMTTYDYEENTSSNLTHFTINNATGEKNNVGKLFMLTAQLDPDLVYRLYWNCLGIADSSKDVMNSAGNKRDKYTATIKLPNNSTATNSFHEYMFIPTMLVSYKEVTNSLKDYLPNIAKKYNVAAAEIGSEFGTINKKQSTRYKIYITDEGNEELLSKFESQELSDGAQNSEVYDWCELIGDTLQDKRAAYRGSTTTTQASLETVIYYLLNAKKTGDVAEVGDLNVLYVSPSNQFISAETLENKLNAIFSSSRNFKAATAVSYVTMQEFQGYGIDEMTEYDLIYFGYVKGKDYKSVGTVPAAGVVLALWEYSQYRPIIFDDALVKTYDDLDYTPTSIGNQAGNMKKYGVYCELNGALVEKDWNFGKMQYIDYANSIIGTASTEHYYWSTYGANWYKYAGNMFKAPEVTKSSGSKSYNPYQYEKLIKACSNKVGRFTSVTADYYYNSSDAINTRIAGSQVFNVKGNITGGVVGVKGKEGAGRNDIASLALYVDKNLDGIYATSEKVGISIKTSAKSNALTALSTGNQFTITAGSKFDKMITKAGSWCLRAYAKDISGKKDVVVASTRGVAAKTKPASKTTINVLQVKIGNSDVIFDGVATGGDDWNYMKIPEGDMCAKDKNGNYVYEDKDFQTDITNFNLKWKLEKATNTLYIHTEFGEDFDYSNLEIRNWIRGRQNAGIGDNNSSYWLGYKSDVENLVVTGDIKVISGRFMEGMNSLVTADFSGCTNIEKVGPIAFWGCKNLEKVIFSKNSEKSISNFLYQDGGTFESSKLTTIYLPNITGSIADNTFRGFSTNISEVYFYGTVGQWWNTCNKSGNNEKLNDMNGGTVYIQKPYIYNTDANSSLPINVKTLVQQCITNEGVNNSKNDTLSIKDVKFVNSSGSEIESAEVAIINDGSDEAGLRWHDGVSKLSTVVTVQVKATYKFNKNTTNIIIPIKLTGKDAVEPADTVVDDGSSTDTIADSEQKTISSFLDLEAVSDYYQYEIASLDIDDVAAAIDEGTMSLGNYDVIVFGVGNSDTKTDSRCKNSSANKTKYGNLISQMKDFMKAKSVIFGYSAIYGTTTGKDSLFYYEFRDYLNLTKFLNEDNSYSSYIVNAKAAPYVAANSQDAGINLREEYQLYLNQLTEFPYTLADNANSGGGVLVGKAGNRPYYRLFMSDKTDPARGSSDNGTINTEVIYSFIEKPLALAADGTTSKIDVNSSYYAYTTTGRVSGSETTKFYIGMSNSPTAIEKELLINMLVAASTLTENGLSFTVYNDVQTNVSGNKTYLYYMTDAATKEVVGAVELDSKNNIHNSEGGITYKKDVYGLPLRIVKEIEKLVSSAPKIGRQRLSLTNIIKPATKYIDGNGNESTSWWTYDFSDEYQTEYFYVGELYDGAVIYDGILYRTYDSGNVYYVKNSGDKVYGKIEGGYVYKYSGKQRYEFENLADYFAEYKNSSNWTKVKWSDVERDSYFSVYNAILKSVGASAISGVMYVYSRTWITHSWYSRKIRTWLKYLDGGTSISTELVISGEDEAYVGDSIGFALVDDKGLISGYSSFLEWLLALIFGGHEAETEWTSSNESVASIEGNNNTATLKGKSAGTTEISFKIYYYEVTGIIIRKRKLVHTYESNTITVTVKEKVPEEVVIEGPIDVEKGKTAKYTAHVLPEGVDGSVTWYTTNSDIATIASDGTLTGVAVGTTEVYAVSNSGGIVSNHITVNVLAPVIAVKTLTLSDQSVNIGDTASFKPVIDPENATYDYIKWTVADGIGTLVKVENTPALDGNYYTSDETKGFELTGLAVGEVPVTVEIIREGTVLKSASATLTITDNIVALTDATLSLPESINVGETSDSLQVLLTPEGASKVTVTWELTGDNPETYATITANAEDSKKASLKGLKAGEAKVKATVYQKGNKVKELTGTVEIKALPMLTIDGPISVEVGETITYKATVLEGHSVADVEWEISDSSIAKLNNNKGKTVTITGMKMGTVTLTATLEGFTATATIAVTDDFGYFKRVYFSLDDTVPLEGEYFRTFFFLDDADDNYENNEHEYNKYANSTNKISEIISPIVENNNFDIFTSELSKDSTNEATKLSENEIREVNRRTARSDKNGAVIEVYSYNENTKTGTKVTTYDSTKKSYVLYPNQVYYVDVRLNPSVCTMPEITIMGILYRDGKSANLMVTRNIQIIPMNMFNLD